MDAGATEAHALLFVIAYSKGKAFERFNNSCYIQVALSFCCWLK